MTLLARKQRKGLWLRQSALDRTLRNTKTSDTPGDLGQETLRRAFDKEGRREQRMLTLCGENSTCPAVSYLQAVSATTKGSNDNCGMRPHIFGTNKLSTYRRAMNGSAESS